MAGLKATIKYAIGSLTGNVVNTAQAGRNHLSWRTVGSILVGGIAGGVVLGSIAGAVVGGVLGSATKYFLS